MPAFSLSIARDEWNEAARRGAIEHILTDREYTLEEFYATGRDVVAGTFRFWDEQGIERPREGQALDFGCGLGRLTRALAAHYDEAWGVDIASEMIDQAWQDAPWNCVFVPVHRDLRAFENDRFAVVYSLLVLQHMPPVYQEQYVTEFFRVVKPGGLVYFQIPDGPADLDYTSCLTMYGTSRMMVDGWVELAGGRILAVEADHMDAGSWPSYRYTCTKGDPDGKQALQGDGGSARSRRASAGRHVRSDPDGGSGGVSDPDRGDTGGQQRAAAGQADEQEAGVPADTSDRSEGLADVEKPATRDPSRARGSDGSGDTGGSGKRRRGRPPKSAR